MRHLIDILNKRLESDENINLKFWRFEMAKYFNDGDNGEITLIYLAHSDTDAKIRLWHSELNTETLTDNFLLDSALDEIQSLLVDLTRIRKVCISEKNTY